MSDKKVLLSETFRWYGPDDTVTLNSIVQMGCKGVISSLHNIAYGEVWPLNDIIAYKKIINSYNLDWSAVESVPVSEDIKTKSADYLLHIENYKKTVENLGKAGVYTIIYNFMPVLDWVRTDLKFKLDDGTQALLFDPIKLAAFELFILKRETATNDYSIKQREKAKIYFNNLSNKEKKEFEQTIIDVFPGVKMGLTISNVKDMLKKYEYINSDQLKSNLSYFLNQVIPICEKSAVKMAIHPDDPPFPILGLPRIVSTENDLKDLVNMIDSPSNGICFCTGSLSAREDNDLVSMIDSLGYRINCFHLRSTQRNSDGSFFEANHLEGSVDMALVVKSALSLMKERIKEGRSDWQIIFRPDHGHTMLDDLDKPTPNNPGYSAIGRLKGLSEIRGLQMGISRFL